MFFLQKTTFKLRLTMMNKTISTLSLVFAATAFTALAQEAPAPAKKHDNAAPQARIARHPLLSALDANKDGVIDAAEIANAPAALKTLDKNGDGQLTRDEIRRPRPEGTGPEGTKNSAQKQGRKHGKKHGSDAPETAPAPNGLPAMQ